MYFQTESRAKIRLLSKEDFIMKKRILSLLIVLCLVCGMVPAVAAAEIIASGTCGENLTWVVTEDGTLTISGEGAMRFSSYDFDSIRPMDDGEDYECLGPWAEYSELVTKIVIENGATSIASNAFSGFTNLERVSIPNSMTAIGDYAFRDCWSLEAVNFPSSLKTIGYDAFGFCFTLTQVTIPEGVIHIDKCAFSSCEGLSYVVLPKSLKILDYGSFDWSPISDVYYCGTEDQWNQLLGDRTIDDIFSSTPDLHFNHMMDTAPGSFYYDAVEWALANRITTGASENSFNPDGQCQRAQVVTFLHRAAENPEPASTRNPFSDVKSSDFFYKPVLWAVEEGITNGVSADKIGSYDVCNRAAEVTIHWPAAGSPEPKTTQNPFKDVKTSDFFYKPVLWAVENGITNGVDATHFGPDRTCNRAQIVTFLYRAYN